MTHSGSERERFGLVVFYAVLLMVGYLAFRVVGPFLAPLAWAGVFAMVLNPVHLRLSQRITRPGPAAALTTLIAVLLIVGPAMGVLSILFSEVTTVIDRIQAGGGTPAASPDLQAWYARLREQTVVPLPADLTSTVTDAVTAVAKFFAGRAGALLQDAASFVFQLFVMLFALFYFLRDSRRIVDTLRQLLPFDPPVRDRIITQTHELVVATVGSTFLVAITQGTLTGIALGLLGFSAPVFWGVITAFLSLLPAVGSGLVWGPAAIWLLVSGDIVRGVILIAVGVGVIGMADNVLRPLLLAGKTTMHGLLVFISLMGGVAAFGFIGLVLGPVAIATLETLLGAMIETPPAPPPQAGAI
ncbi:MAG: AI-2E family transporter [Acidobacteria bacterium]|nr:AI-2E family transporter [Acidobacteriota bacterium]